MRGVGYEKHYAGELAYWDTLRSGLVPCRVLNVIKDPEIGMTKVTIRVTGERKPYRLGEEHTVNSFRVLPRSRVKKTKYGHHLLQNFRWMSEGEQDNENP